ncbi:MAG: hypothetical protein AAF648_02670 [Pseudomonadota bacterium]
MNTGFEEKSAWIQFAALAFVLGGYFLTANQMYGAGVMEIKAYVPVFAVSVILLIIVLIAGNAAALILSRSDQSDERDKLIAWRAEYSSSWILGVGIVGAISAMVVGVSTVLIAHGLLASLLLSELLAMALRILFYRRGV